MRVGRGAGKKMQRTGAASSRLALREKDRDEFSSSNDVNVNVNYYAILKTTGAARLVLRAVKRESGAGRSEQYDLMPLLPPQR